VYVSDAEPREHWQSLHRVFHHVPGLWKLLHQSGRNDARFCWLLQRMLWQIILIAVVRLWKQIHQQGSEDTVPVLLITAANRLDYKLQTNSRRLTFENDRINKVVTALGSVVCDFLSTNSKEKEVLSSSGDRCRVNTLYENRVMSYVCRHRHQLRWNNWNGSGSCLGSSCRCRRLKTACCVACTSNLSSWCRCRESWSECRCFVVWFLVTLPLMHFRSRSVVLVHKSIK